MLAAERARARPQPLGAEAHEHGLHGARAQIPAAVRGWTVDDDGMATAGFPQHGDIPNPYNPCFHHNSDELLPSGSLA